MDARTGRTLVLGIAIGGLGAALVFGTAAPARTGQAAAQPNILVVQPTQGAPLNPREFVPLQNPPGSNPSQMPFPGSGGQQNCNRVLFFYQGHLFQLQPGPHNGGNPEFYYMQPYNGPEVPGFPQTPPGIGPSPDQLPVLKF